jgi:hypothetical protein
VNKISDTETARQWAFRCDGANRTPRWRWECRSTDGAPIRSSTETFQSLRVAIENARRHGFPADPNRSRATADRP